jgi:4-hydroxy-3-polyprenylbenzoate decarboxylase
MPYSSLAEFLEELAEHKELARVGAEVDPALEIAEIARRVAHSSGPALLFDHVRGHSAAVVANLLGTEERACRALDIDSLDNLAERTESLIAKNTPQNWFDRLKVSADDAGSNKFRPRPLKSGACQQVVHIGRDVDLGSLPLTGEGPGALGPAITAGRLITPERAGDRRRVTACSAVRVDANRLAIVDDGQSDFAIHWAAHRAAREKMPAALVLGGDPAGLIAAFVETPPDADALHAVGLLRGKALDVVKCRTHALEVPAEADFVLEGYFDPEVPAAEATKSASENGAGGAHAETGLAADHFHVTAITHRSNPIFPLAIDAGSRGELAVLRRVRERMLLPAVRAVAPDVVDMYLPALGGAHRYAFVAIRKRYAHHARQIAAALWGSSALRFTKFLVLVDEGADVHNVERVLAEVGANVAPECDLFWLDAPAQQADHANTLGTLGRHVAIDATRKIAGERAAAGPARQESREEIERFVTARWREYQLDAATGTANP